MVFPWDSEICALDYCQVYLKVVILSWEGVKHVALKVPWFALLEGVGEHCSPRVWDCI